MELAFSLKVLKEFNKGSCTILIYSNNSEFLDFSSKDAATTTPMDFFLNFFI